MGRLNCDAAYDVAIVGGGPAGAALAIHLLKRGRRPLIVEKESFPRYHIGESLTGECKPLLDELGMTPYLEAANFQVKRGVTVSGANARAKFWVPVEGVREDGTRFPATTWHVRRDEFDAKLLESAIERGAGHVRATCKDVLFEDGAVAGITISEDGGAARTVAVRALADCSGQKTFLASKGIVGPKCRTDYENQTALFCQMRHVTRDAPPIDSSTHIFYGKRHHWAWAIPLSEDITSVGVVMPKTALRLNERTRRDAFLDAAKRVNPELLSRTKAAEITDEVRAISNYSYRIERFTGPGYLCVGDSHRFLDPIFSFGVLVALQEARSAAAALDRYIDEPNSSDHFDRYAAKVARAQTVIEYVIRTFWDYPLAFLRLAHFSHSSDIAEIFSGRLYSEDVLDIEAVGLMRDLLARSGKIAA